MKGLGRAAPFLPPLAALLAAACVSVDYTELAVDQAPPGEALGHLQPGVSRLDDCLAALGAPREVQEDGAGAVLSWSWERANGWGLGVSLPLSDSYSASLQYFRDRALPNHLRLHFDAGWVLQEIAEERAGG